MSGPLTVVPSRVRLMPSGVRLVPSRWLRLPRRTIRLRLTALYAALFLASGVGLLAITYVLVDNAESPMLSFQGTKVALRGPARPAGGQTSVTVRSGVPVQLGNGLGRPRAAAFAVPGAAAKLPRACLAADPGARPDASRLASQATKCERWFRAQVAAERAGFLDSLLTDSAIALAVMTVGALGLGWLVSGRVLRPLRTIAVKAQQISASNLHERLAVAGPDDELKDLADTMDGLLSRLESAFAAQRQFVANASHELRTPLARQQTMVEVALSDPGRSVASLAAVCERVLAAGQQQERLIEGLLTLARSQRGLDQAEPVDLAAVAREIALSRAPEASERGVELMLLDGPAACPGDARLAERLVGNLLDNAIRHNLVGGRVLVRSWSRSGRAVVQVTNTGPVIDPAEIPGLLEPFRRRGAARTATASGDGLGLGLSIVSAIAGAHRADLVVQAQPGGGLDVQVRFPGLPGDIDQRSGEAAQRELVASGHPG